MRAFEQKVVIVTGGSAGVGRATALEFARQGARVGLIARGVERLKQAQKEIEALGGVANYFAADVSDHRAVEESVAYFEKELGPIDIWVNDAMTSVFSPVEQMEPEEYKRVTEVTYLGYVYCTLSVLKRMKARNRGLIIQVGSALAYRSIPLQSAYCAAKHAIKGFTESLRTELLHDQSGVQICQVHLPAVNTPQFSWVKSRLPNKPQPVPPIFQPEVPARAIAWVAKHPRREFWVAFPTLKAIVGEKIAPGFADRFLARVGYGSQQTQEPVSPNRKDNLWAPVPGPFGAHGEFDQKSKRLSIELWLRTHGRSWTMALVAVAVGASAYLSRTSDSPRRLQKAA